MQKETHPAADAAPLQGGEQQEIPSLEGWPKAGVGCPLPGVPRESGERRGIVMGSAHFSQGGKERWRMKAAS